MKVRVSYSLELEDVLDLINNIISDCQQNLFNASKNLKYYTGDSDKLYKEINQVRETLNLVDAQLEDVFNMAIGLENVQKNPSSLGEEKEVSKDES